MEGHIHEWLNLLIRWLHLIVGIAWIGASFYFNWLENRLDRSEPQEPGIAGNLWAVHGGGFYHLKKFKVGPESLPQTLHWFKWEAYTTWLTGMTLLCVVYYFNASLFLIGSPELTPAKAIVIGLVAIFGSWFVYDALCRSVLQRYPRLLGLILFVFFAVLAWALSAVFSGRGAFIHVGAAIGTVMVANVFFVIIPAQREMVNALKEQRTLDPRYGKNGLLRSRHNNYLTLPVLFIMISNHFPSTYGSEWNWLILVALSLISVFVRHYFNIRHIHKNLWWMLPVGLIAMAGVMWATAPKPLPAQTATAAISSDLIQPVIARRCSVCHSNNPSFPGFSAPPQGIVFDQVSDIEQHAERIHAVTVVSHIMPPGNLTEITEGERQQIDQWYRQQ